MYEVGVDMVTGSLLPSHSDVQLSCLTGERIKVTEIIIQQVRAMPIYGLDVLAFGYPYITDILRYA